MGKAGVASFAGVLVLAGSLRAELLGTGDGGMGRALEAPAVAAAPATPAPTWPDYCAGAGTSGTLRWVRSTRVGIGEIDSVRDTPVFRNRGIRDLSEGGICYGIVRLTATWYRYLVRPVLENPSLYTEWAPFSNPFGIDGVHGDNIEDFRLRDYSESDRMVETLRRAAHFQDEFAGIGAVLSADPRLGRADQRWLADLWKREVRETGSSGLWFRCRRTAEAADPTEASHAVLVVGVQPGIALDEAGTEVGAVRYDFIDPNMIDGVTATSETAPIRNQYVLYFPGTRRMAFSPEYVARYRGYGFELQGCGAYALPGDLHWLDVSAGEAESTRFLETLTTGRTWRTDRLLDGDLGGR